MASFMTARNEWRLGVELSRPKLGPNAFALVAAPPPIPTAMRAVLAAVAALACVSRAESALRGDAADGWTRAVANVYRATQAGAGPLLGEVTMQDTNRGCVFGLLPTRSRARRPRSGSWWCTRPANSHRWCSLLLQPNLVGLPPGRYGFFVHTNGAWTCPGAVPCAGACRGARAKAATLVPAGPHPAAAPPRQVRPQDAGRAHRARRRVRWRAARAR